MSIATGFSAIVFIALGTQLVKSMLEAAGLSQASKWHDPLVWLTAFAAGIVGFIANDAVTRTITAPIVWQDMGLGVMTALSAVGTYHLVTHPYFDSPPTSTTATLTVPQTTVSVPSVWVQPHTTPTPPAETTNTAAEASTVETPTP